MLLTRVRALMAIIAIGGAFCFLIIASVDCAQAGARRDRASERHKNSCIAWCDANKPRCYKCVPTRGCGKGYKVINSWTGFGENYYACERRITREEGSLNNRDECIRWCDQNKPRCAKCFRKVGCDSGFKQIKSFGGRGHNWYACEKRPNTADRKTECWAWCDDNKPRCSHCSKKVGCGAGFKKIKSFKGKGLNYYACEDRGKSNENEQACKRYCKGNFRCKKCQNNRICPWNTMIIKSWKGKGRNWYACGMRSALSSRNHSRCIEWCHENEECSRCERIAGCGKGYKQLKSWTGKGDNYYACKDRGGSEHNYQRCYHYCHIWQEPYCRKCDRSPGCGTGFEQMKAFRGEGKNWYACRRKTSGSAPLGGYPEDY